MGTEFATESTSSSLLQKSCDGNLLAQQQLYEVYYPLIFAWSRRAGLNHDDALDNAHQVFVKLFTSLHAFDPDRGKFRAWLWTVTRNLAADAQRRSARYDHHRDPIELPSQRATPESATSARLPKIVARRALEILWQRYRGRTLEIAIALLVNDQSADCVAKDHDVSLGSVYTIRSRALKMLREALRELEFDDVENED